MAAKARKAPAAERPQAMTFETAMASLRRGAPIRRKAWHSGSLIFRVGPDVFVKLPDGLQREPRTWRPYPQDFLANDWQVVT